jgi:hypothetical protein
MPAREGGKNPMFKHMNQQYSWDSFGQTHVDQYEHGALILLPRELIVIDIDDKEEFFSSVYILPDPERQNNYDDFGK